MRALLLCVGVAAAACSAVGSGATAAQDAGVDAHKHPLADFDAGAVTVTGPDKLSETGLYADFASRTLAAGVISYAPRYPLWSDAAAKDRYLLLPPNAQIDTANMDGWVFPVGTKAWKEFRVGGALIETRLLWKARPDAWFEVAYAWSADGTDAIAAPNGVKNALGNTHDIPTQVQCDGCHGNVTDGFIGVSALQLSNGPAGMLAQLAAQGSLTQPPGREFEVPGAGVTKDALAYLHANCGHCHNDTTRMKNQTALRLDVHVSDATPEQTGAERTSPGLVMRHILPPNIDKAVVPGDPSQSGLWLRMQRRGDDWEMPPLATKVVDDAGVALVGAWITALK